MANKFFPSTLTRKQYLIRCLIVFAVLLAAFLFFVAAPTGDSVHVAGILLQIVAIVAFVYNIIGLSIPRLKNAQLNVLWVLLAVIPFGVLVLFGMCAIVREKV